MFKLRFTKKPNSTKMRVDLSKIGNGIGYID